MSLARQFAGAALVAGLSASCTALLDPDRLDDVIRCDLASDCPQPENNRHVAACVDGGGSGDVDDGGVEQVCVAQFARVHCKPQSYGADTLFARRFSEASLAADLYGGACDGRSGFHGCWPTLERRCEPGLQVHPGTGLCDDADSGTYLAVGETLEDWVGQDVLDQFCRSYFCDDRFVCDRSHGEDLCVPCDPTRSFGRGGCYDIYVHGERSSVYLGDNEANCPAQASGEGARFGPVPEGVAD